MGYYIANKGVQQGPFELSDLPQRGLHEDSLVWTDGMPDWKRADAVPEVAAMLQPGVVGVVTPPVEPTIERPSGETVTMAPASEEIATPEPMQPAESIQPTPAPFTAAPNQFPGPIAYQTPAPNPTNGMAVASMVLGIVAYPMSMLYCAGVIGALLAIIFGFIARARIKRGETDVGAGMALAGIILGLVYFGLLLLAVGFFFIVGLGMAIHNKP
jgi:hypothetical protein